MIGKEKRLARVGQLTPAWYTHWFGWRQGREGWLDGDKIAGANTAAEPRSDEPTVVATKITDR